MTSKKLPRGIRNNNPLNIRIGNNWFGEVSNPTDHEFEQFNKMEYGCRAAFIILSNYLLRHNLKTIPEIISRWAPSSENSTQNYIKTVLNVMGADEKMVINWWNKEQMISLFRAMCYVENGVVINVMDIEKGYEMALFQRKNV